MATAGFPDLSEDTAKADVGASIRLEMLFGLICMAFIAS